MLEAVSSKCHRSDMVLRGKEITIKMATSVSTGPKAEGSRDDSQSRGVALAVPQIKMHYLRDSIDEFQNDFAGMMFPSAA
jgi:hypothetical protein